MGSLLSSSIHYLEKRETGMDDFSEVETFVLDAINQKVAAAESLAEILDFVFDATRNIFPCDRIGVAFLEDNGARLVSHWARALYEPLLLTAGYWQDIRGSSLERVLESGEPRIINDLELYLEQHPESLSTQLILREGVRSSMTCPLIVEGRAVGFLFRSCRQPNMYDDHLVRLHEMIAERLSQAVEKAWRIEQLAAANRNYMELLGFVSHELKSPVASLVMDGEMLRGDFLGPLNEAQWDKVGRMMDKGQYLLGLINDYMDLARVESDELALEIREADFEKDILATVRTILQTEFDAHHVHLEIDVPVPLRIACDPGLLTIAVVNLLGNAIKYGNEEGEVRLSARSSTVGATHVCRIAVWNKGPGFPREQYPRLFRKFSRLQTRPLLQRKGTGVGLYTTWRVVQRHGGKIWAESEEGAWAEFVIEIPQPPHV